MPAIMGHLIFIIFHVAAVLFGLWLLIITIPLHMIYSSGKRRRDLLEVIATSSAPQLFIAERKRRERNRAIVAIAIIAALLPLLMLASTQDDGVRDSANGVAPADTFAAGLEIRDVSSTRSWSDGEQILTVVGNLANAAEKPRSLPMVKVVLVNSSDAAVQEVVVLPPGETLPVGGSVRFEARISNPADTAERIKVSVAPRRGPP